MKRAMRCHDFGSERDKVLGQNSCQPEGLQPESALAALLDLAIE